MPCQHFTINSGNPVEDEKQFNLLLDCLYREFYPKFKKWLLKQKVSPEDIKDIFQEALVILFKRFKENRIAPEVIYSGFLFNAARFILLRMYRKKKRLKVVPFPDHYQPIDIQAQRQIEKAVNDYYEKKIVEECLQQSTPRCQELIKDRYINGLTIDEITQKYNYANNHVTSQMISNCMRRLREYFNKSI